MAYVDLSDLLNIEEVLASIMEYVKLVLVVTLDWNVYIHLLEWVFLLHLSDVIMLVGIDFV